MTKIKQLYYNYRMKIKRKIRILFDSFTSIFKIPNGKAGLIERNYKDAKDLTVFSIQAFKAKIAINKGIERYYTGTANVSPILYHIEMKRQIEKILAK